MSQTNIHSTLPGAPDSGVTKGYGEYGRLISNVNLSIWKMFPNLSGSLTQFIFVIYDSKSSFLNLFIISAHTVSRSNDFHTFTTYSVKYYFLLLA